MYAQPQSFRISWFHGIQLPRTAAVSATWVCGAAPGVSAFSFIYYNYLLSWQVPRFAARLWFGAVTCTAPSCSAPQAAAFGVAPQHVSSSHPLYLLRKITKLDTWRSLAQAGSLPSHNCNMRRARRQGEKHRTAGTKASTCNRRCLKKHRSAAFPDINTNSLSVLMGQTNYFLLYLFIPWLVFLFLKIRKR